MRRARTGAPAWASTTFTPRVRSMVLLPDMLEPLTTMTLKRRRRGVCRCGPPCLRAAGDGRWLRHRCTDPGPTNSGKGSAGCSKAWLAREHSASISPAACSQRRTAAPDMRAPVFHAQRQVRRPQDERLQDADDDVIARIQIFDEALEARQLPRGRFAIGVERRAQVRPAAESWKCSRSMRTSTSESSPSSWAASSTAETADAQDRRSGGRGTSR